MVRCILCFVVSSKKMKKYGLRGEPKPLDAVNGVLVKNKEKQRKEEQRRVEEKERLIVSKAK